MIADEMIGTVGTIPASHEAHGEIVEIVYGTEKVDHGGVARIRLPAGYPKKPWSRSHLPESSRRPRQANTAHDQLSEYSGKGLVDRFVDRRSAFGQGSPLDRLGGNADLLQVYTNPGRLQLHLRFLGAD